MEGALIRLTEFYTVLESLSDKERQACLTWLQENTKHGSIGTDRQLEAFLSLANKVNRSFHLEAILQTGLQTILQVLSFDAGAIYLTDEEQGVLTLSCARGIHEDYAEAIRKFQLGQAIVGKVGQTGKSLFISNLSGHNSALEPTRRNGHLKSFYFTALKTQGKIVGVMPVGLFSERLFSSREMEFIDHLGSLIALAIDRTKLFREEQALLRNSETLYEIERILMDEVDIRTAARGVLRVIRDNLGYDFLILTLRGPDDSLEVLAQVGYEKEQNEIPGIIRMGEGVIGKVAAEGKTINIPDVSLHESYIAVRPGIRSEVAIPIHGEEESILGVLNVESARPAAFGERDLQVLTSVANQLSVAIRNALHRRERDRYYDELQAAYMGTLHLFSDFLEATFPFLSGHSDRVSSLVLPIAEAMGFTTDQILNLRVAAEFHDVGKIYIPREILLKPASLTVEERRAINEHPRVGSQMVAKVPIFKEFVAPWIQSHHEWMDGSGYPEGLKGNQIPLASRIITVVDAWDAMTSKRPYREALSHNEAIEQLHMCTETQFDPDVVRVFLDHLPQISGADDPRPHQSF